MGVNIYLVDMRSGEDIVGWDSCRSAGDKEVLSVLASVGFTSHTHAHPYDCVSFERPTCVEDFRTALHKAINYNTERWDQMCDLLAGDEHRGLYFSY